MSRTENWWTVREKVEPREREEEYKARKQQTLKHVMTCARLIFCQTHATHTLSHNVMGAQIQATIFSPRWNSLKITVGCRLCAYPSILFSPDEDTLKITVGCLTSIFPSMHTKNCRHVGPHGPRGKRGLWARPPVLTPVLVQA